MKKDLYVKSSKKTVFIFIGIVAIILVIAGIYFFKQIEQPPIETNDQQGSEQSKEKKSIESVSNLALLLDDLPAEWEISTRGEKTKSDIDAYGLNLGWKEGYSIVFRKTASKDIQVSQSISIYPQENISLVLNGVRESLKIFRESVDGRRIEYQRDEFGDRYRFEELSDPLIGDDSIAYKYISLDTAQVAYYIEFVKSSYYEIIVGYDYELIKELASKAEEKI